MGRTILAALAFGFITAIGTTVAAQPPASAGPVDTTDLATVVFGSDPQYNFLGPAGPYYPERALRMNVTGSATIACEAGAAGQLSDCTVIEEAPKGYGFAPAALMMARRGWVKLDPSIAEQPHTADGKVLIKINYSGPSAKRRP